MSIFPIEFLYLVRKMSLFPYEIPDLTANCQYFFRNFITFEQHAIISSGISLLLSKLSIFPCEFHYCLATCQYFLVNFATVEQNINIST